MSVFVQAQAHVSLAPEPALVVKLAPLLAIARSKRLEGKSSNSTYLSQESRQTADPRAPRH